MENNDIEISPSAIAEYNYMIQESKPEDHRQLSFEKLGITDWKIESISGEEILKLQSYVETKEVVASSYAFWKLCGKNVSLEDLAKEVDERGPFIPESAKDWVGAILPENFSLDDMEEKIKKGEIDPPLLFFPVLNNKDLDMGLLNLGNILDGNHRMMEIAMFLRNRSKEYVKDFKMDVFVGRVDFVKYLKFQALYMTKPYIKRAQSFVKGFMGENVEKIDKKHVMNFFERWYLLLQRIGFVGNEEEEEYIVPIQERY